MPDNRSYLLQTESAKPAVKNVKVKALYLTGWTVGSMKKVRPLYRFGKYIPKLIHMSLILRMMMDMWAMNHKYRKLEKLEAWMKKYDVDKVLKAFHDNNIHIIGRIVCFKDPVLSSKKPELAIKDIDGGF